MTDYGTAGGVEILIGDIVVARDFTTTTIPTSGDVGAFLDDIEAELHRELAAAGFQVPVSTSANPREAAWLAGIAEKGAAALILGSIPMTAIAPGAQDAGTNRMEMYQAFFNRAIENIRENRFTAARTRGRLGAVFAGSQSDTDGNRKKPIFKRDDGRRSGGPDSLTE